MSEPGTPVEVPSGNVPDTTTDSRVGSSSNPRNQSTNGTQRGTRPSNRTPAAQSSTNRDFEGATPKLGAVLALRSENIHKKVNYDRFLEKLSIYVVNELKNGDSLVQVTKNPNEDTIEIFKKENKPNELSDEDKKSTVDIEIHKEEIKEYVKDLKLLKAN